MQRTPLAERWQIVCGQFTGTERSAVELLAAGVGRETDYLPVTVTADAQCGSCGCEFDPLYKRALSLLRA